MSRLIRVVCLTVFLIVGPVCVCLAQDQILYADDQGLHNQLAITTFSGNATTTALTGTPVVITLFDTSVDTGQFTVAVDNDAVLVALTGFFTVDLSAVFVGPNNGELDCATFVDAVVAGAHIATEASNGGRTVTASAKGLFFVATQPVTVDVRCASSTGGTWTFEDMTLQINYTDPTTS